MKKIIILLITVTLFAGCKKDEPVTPVTTTPTTTNNQTQSFTINYELDGVPHVSVIHSSSIISGQMSLGGFDNTDASIATAVILRVENPSVSSYSLGDTANYVTNNLNISLLIPNAPGQAGSYFYSNMTGTILGNNNAQITITELDYTNKIVSGTFNARVVYNYDTTEVHEITNGVFTDVPFQ